ncbi:MAG: hypothetical protein AAGG44_10285 [Planctomycetota bacterium]
MSKTPESTPEQSRLRPRASLLSLLTLTALMALAFAIGLAVRKQHALKTQREGLLAVSRQLIVEDEDRLAASSLVATASDFSSWQVYVPEGREYEVYLGVGDVGFEKVPPIQDTFSISAGMHRITFRSRDRTKYDFQYDVYLDGEKRIERVMGKEWMPNGWSSASGIGWPEMEDRPEAPMQLAARSYQPKHDFGRDRYFHGQGDSSVTRLGYRLWIDEKNQSYPEASPFLVSLFEGGLSDGLRYKLANQQWEWQFFRPSLEGSSPVIQVSPEFVLADGKVISNPSQDYGGWVIDQSRREDAPDLTNENFLYLVGSKLGAYVAAENSPVIEMKWDVDKPDAVGIRLAEVPENERIERWTLRIQGGSEHLWRKLVFADTAIDTVGDKLAAGDMQLDLSSGSNESAMLWWHATETLPLQIVSDENEAYSNLGLYDGLAVMQGLEVPVDNNFRVTATIATEIPGEVGVAFPGGAIMEEIQIEIDGTTRDWIWLYAKARSGE